MGMYTELMLRCEIDKEAYQILQSHVNDFTPDNNESPFDNYRTLALISKGGSFYFPLANHFELEAAFENNPIQACYFLSLRANIKNYGNEIEAFLEWLNPHLVRAYQFIGYVMYEEAEYPTLLYVRNREIVESRIFGELTESDFTK